MKTRHYKVKALESNKTVTVYNAPTPHQAANIAARHMLFPELGKFDVLQVNWFDNPTTTNPKPRQASFRIEESYRSIGEIRLKKDAYGAF